MSKPSTPRPASAQDLAGQARQIAQTEAEFNRYDNSNPFGGRRWNGGRQEQYLSPEMQGVFSQMFEGLNRQPGRFESSGIQGSPFAGPAQQMAGNTQAQKGRAQGMNSQPNYGGYFQPGASLPGAQFRQGQPLTQGQTAHGVDNSQSAREIAELYGDLIPKPEEFDPLRFQGVYEQLFGGRLTDFNQQYGRR